MTNEVINTILKTTGASLVSVIIALFTGKTIRHLVYKIIAGLAKKTSTNVDNQLLQDVAQDLGVENDTDVQKDIRDIQDVGSIMNKKEDK